MGILFFLIASAFADCDDDDPLPDYWRYEDKAPKKYDETDLVIRCTDTIIDTGERNNGRIIYKLERRDCRKEPLVKEENY